MMPRNSTIAPAEPDFQDWHEISDVRSVDHLIEVSNESLFSADEKSEPESDRTFEPLLSADFASWSLPDGTIISIETKNHSNIAAEADDKLEEVIENSREFLSTVLTVDAEETAEVSFEAWQRMRIFLLMQ